MARDRRRQRSLFLTAVRLASIIGLISACEKDLSQTGGPPAATPMSPQIDRISSPAKRVRQDDLSKLPETTGETPPPILVPNDRKPGPKPILGIRDDTVRASPGWMEILFYPHAKIHAVAVDSTFRMEWDPTCQNLQLEKINMHLQLQMRAPRVRAKDILQNSRGDDFATIRLDYESESTEIPWTHLKERWLSAHPNIDLKNWASLPDDPEVTQRLIMAARTGQSFITLHDRFEPLEVRITCVPL